MKKLSYVFFSLLLVLSCGLFSACDPNGENASVTLSTSNVAIYLGETENNSAVVNALPNNVDVKMLEIVYDTTYIKITQSQKLSDGSFNLTVVSKVTDFGTTTPIAVEVKAGDASAVFYVELVLPVESIVAKTEPYIAYSGTKTSLNLLNCVTFEPEGTKQTGVEFALDQEVSYAHIEGNLLVIDSGAEFNFLTGEIPSVKVKVNSTVDGKSSIGTEFNVKIIPNVKLLANVISVTVDYNGAENVALSSTDYNLSITKNEATGTYQTDTFNVKIAIPSNLGIEVDVDSQTGGGLATNILNYLTYSKSVSQDRTNPANVLDVYTFAFEASSTLQGEGDLRFVYHYANYAQDASLSANFVGLASDNTLLEKVKVSVLMPITAISAVSDCTIDKATGQYIIYKNYQGAYGSAVSFVALPAGTSQSNLVLVQQVEKDADENLIYSVLVYNRKGELLEFAYNEDTMRYECPISSNEQLYVKGVKDGASLKCYSLAVGKEGIVKEITFKVLEGGSGLGFVDDTSDITGLETARVYMQQGLFGEALVYSPGAVLADFVFDSQYVQVENADVVGYFKLSFINLSVGEHILTISTVNGYSVQAIVQVIEPITNVNVTLGDNADYISGIGSFAVLNGDIANIALKNGYSALLNYVTNEGASVQRVEYGFYEPELYSGVYDTNIKALKNVTSATYLADIGISEYDFVEATNYLSTQNLNLTNLLTGVATGVVVLKVTIYGQIVDAGMLKEVAVATKYIYVEVYNPVKQIEANAKNVTLRAQNQLDAGYQYLATTTIDVSAFAGTNLIATYNKVFIDLGTYTEVAGEGDSGDIITSKFTRRISGTDIFEVVYDYTAKTLTITAKYVDANIAKQKFAITLIAGDFINPASGTTLYSSDLLSSGYDLKTYTINLSIIETTVVDDIKVLNLTEDKEQSTDTVYDSEDNVVSLGQKTYSTIYIDTSKSTSVVYKIYTEVSPSTAFNKDLEFTFNPNSGYSQAMISTDNDGTITVLSNQGGTGVITITPKDSHSKARTVRIPIVVADGNSYETAYEISSLSEIKYSNKHYVLTNPTTYLLDETLFKGQAFSGGLYGKRATDTSSAYATIRLDGCSLFTFLASSAQIKYLNLVGDVNSSDLIVDTNTYNNGFVAYTNSGLIQDIKVTTFVDSNGNYVPSTLFVGSDLNNVGGLVGQNLGTIKDCTFAGSINITTADVDITANAITGVNSGTIESCKIIVAKFLSEVDARKIVADSESATETIYVNGVVDKRDGSARTNSVFDDATNAYITVQNYNGVKFVLDQNLFIKNNSGHSYGESQSRYGIVFYYKATNANKQSTIAGLNVIKFEDLFDFANIADETEKASIAKQLKISALNAEDNTICSFVSVGADAIEIKGVGAFRIIITSEYDYTEVFELNLISVYYASAFSITYNGSALASSDVLEIVQGQTREIVSQLNNKIVYNGAIIELCSNDFYINYNLIYAGNTVEDALKYITNNKLGTHTVNMLFDWSEKTEVYASLDAGYGATYNAMLNKLFGLTDNSGNANLLLGIQLKQGTTQISTNITNGSIEPSDTFSFDATIVTDVADDYISALDTSGTIKGIEIYNQTNYPCNDYFNVIVNKVADYTYNIQLGLDLTKFVGEGSANIMDFINKQYTIRVYAFSNNGADQTRYDVFATVNFTLLPQTISNMNTALYNVTQSTTSGVNVSASETATSVIMPSESGLFVVDMYPTYASFDYLEIVATSNTTSKLNYRLEEYDTRSIPESSSDTLGWVENYKTVTKNVDASGNKLYEAISDKNGIRIYNNNTYNTAFYEAYAELYGSEHLNNVNNIGKYFIKIFADSSFDTDTIFTITVKAYLNGEVLTAQSAFTLYMRMPEAPQLTIDGQTKVYKLVGEEITADVLVSDDQTDFHPYIARNKDNNELSVLDSKQVEGKIYISYWQVSDNVEIGYKRYKISISFADSYDYKNDSTQLKLVVETTKIFNGKSIKVSSDVYIYMVEYLPEQDDIKIYDAIDGVYNVTSLKKTELKLADLVNVSAHPDFVSRFNDNYYYPLNADENATGFTFGKNVYTIIVDKETYDCKNKAEVLASYLSYVNGNEKTALAIYRYDANLGARVLECNQDDLNRVKFSIDPSTGKLYVQGGDTTGRVEMALEIQYRMPDNTIYTYEYRFAIVNSLYTTEDLPIEIANNNDFLNIINNDTAYDYILTKDLNLYDFNIIENTDKIKSFDGNNHTINIWNFAKVESGSANFALFNQISSATTIKNLTVNLYYLSELEVGDAVTSAQVAGFALTNNGAIYNCEVMAFKSTDYNTASTVLGLKLDADIEATVAGFVINNTGSITNSRVGGESKLVTTIDYNTDENGVTTDTLTEAIKTGYTVSIKASGTVSGFVVNNSGVIASSFVKNINVQNTYYKQETRVTTGFVNDNSGTISLCYTEGGFENSNDIQASIGGLEGSGIMSGFVYLNNGTITDSYSNLMITNTKDQVGRLGAGFVFENTESGIIERCYSASKIISNNVTQMNFAGIKDFGGYNNYGTVKNSYYYITNSTDEISIESMMNTQINAVSVADDDKNFYGFSFSSKSNAGTWKITSHGPRLLSPNDIAHSVRAKYTKPDSVQSELDYIFVYCDGYELGTANNPIIIRDAKEFNSVLGGSISNDIKNNYSNGKIYGAYRLVNHINMLELVPEEEQQTEYKVNLLSTKLILTGEYTESSNRNGSFNGNGLTISNLAISNSSTQSDGFGLFKSIENGASVANVNISLSSGGVTADHTVFVGTIAGSLVDSYAYNIKIVSQDSSQSVNVIGANLTGGAFGRVVGASYLSNIYLENVSVTSTYNSNNFNGNLLYQIENIYDRKATGYADISIAGGVAGVVDIYTKQQFEGDIVYAEQVLDTNVQSIAVKGGLVIEGMSAGGVFGYIGEYVVAKDLSLEITNDVIDSKIIAYNCYAGGIAGYSEGYLYQIKSEHTATWQTSIEDNYNNYYTSTNNDSIDRGNEELFISAVGYKQKAVGGLVGVLNGGKVTIAYSKLNVIANAKYVGGAFGFVSYDYKSTEASATKNALALSEVYASGDVYSDYPAAYIAGLAGFFNDPDAVIDKLNAVNYWGTKSYNLFGETNDCFNVGTKTTDGRQISPIFNTIESIKEQNVDENNQLTLRVYSLQGVQFVDKDTVAFNTVKANSMQSYYDYQGVVIDNGAQVDLMFKENGWYGNGNWSRETLEALPHIKYINSSNVLEIRSTADFYLFSLYGNDPDALFVVNGKERESGTKLIDCTGWQTTYAGLRASIIGATNEDGFENLNVTLFRTANGSSISNLKFKNCSSAFVNQATSCKFKNLTYTECTFATINGGNLSGVTNEVSGSTEFETITFDECRLIGSSANTAGFLFASSGTGYTDITINNIRLNNNKTNSYSINKEYTKTSLNFGLLFGKASCRVDVGVVKMYDNMTVNISNAKQDDDYDKENSETYNVNIGLIAGNAHNLVISLSDLTILPDDTNDLSKTGLQVNGPTFSTATQYASSAEFNVGGIVGFVNDTLQVSANNAEPSPISVYFAPEISVKNMQSAHTLNLGTLCGNATTIKTSGNALFILGQKNSADNTVTFTSLEYDLAEADYKDSGTAKGNNFIGGIAGKIESLESDSDNSFISYYGDIKVGKTYSTSKTDTFLNLGGLFGSAGSSAGSVLKNAFFDGTISFGETVPKYLRVGAIVGNIEEGNTLNIYNVVASGEIVLSGDNGDVVLDDTRYAAGLVGCVDGTLKIGNETAIDGYYYKTAVITTLYSKKNYANVDALVNVNKEEDSTATIIIYTVNGNSLAQYSSTLTLSTSKLDHNADANTSDNITGFVENYSYAGITDSKEGGKVTNTVFQAVGGDSSTFNGTKLNPYILTANGAYTKDNQALSTTVKDDSFYAKIDGKSYTLTGSSSRKLYVYVQNDVEWINYQLSLENAFLFSDGKAIYSAITPINTVDDKSAVSGVVAKVYIDDTDRTDGSYATSFSGVDCYAGFVNKNSGIIYTCSAQECMNKTKGMNNSTQFYGYFSNTTASGTDDYPGFAGFVCYNDGYIFGSNANMNFSKYNKLPVSGFVANNRETGNISYCYASGANYAENGDLFTTSTAAEYLDTMSDFNEWLGITTKVTEEENISGYNADVTVYDSFWNTLQEKITQNTDGSYSYTGDLYDFRKWTNKTINVDGTATKAIDWLRDIVGKNESNEPKWTQNAADDVNSTDDSYDINCDIMDALYGYYSNGTDGIVGTKKHKNTTDWAEKEKIAFQGTFEACYTIVLAKGTIISTDLPDNVYSEELASELKGTANVTNLYNSTSDPDNSKLITNDTYGYYSCDPDYNWNYPTLSGGAFVNFDFIKRSTLCVYNETSETYEIKDKATVASLVTSGVSLNGYDIIRNTADEDADINKYFKQVFYVQIPNLKVLQNLQKFIDGLDMVGDGVYRYQYSKFVIISDLNFGYEGSIIGKSGVNFITNISTNTSNAVKIEIDAYNNTFRNLTLETSNLIESVTAVGQPIEMRKFVFQNITLNKSTGIIGSISSNVTIDIVNFGQSSDSSGVQEQILITPPDSANDIAENVVGVLVGINSGVISNCKLNTIITTSGNTTKDYILGGLVGRNLGTVTNSEFSGKVQIKERGQNVDIIFGAFVGENGNSETAGTVSLCQVKEGNSNVYYLSEGGAIYYSIDAATENNDPVLTATDDGGNEQEIEMKAQIFVATKGVATVGGIAGKHIKGIINQCVTFASSESTEVQQNLGILVGDEEYQMIAYAGGIVGELVNGVIHDSANRMNITALSVWQFTTNNNDTTKYKYKVSGEGISAGTGDLNDKTLAVYYADADITPVFKFDNKGMLYVYREMTSLAYAGGIVGYGLKATAVEPTVETANVRLINYGEISGGYRAVKPVATITASVGDTTGLTVAFWAGFAAAIAGSVVGGVNIAKIFKLNNPMVGGMVFLFIASQIGANLALEMFNAAAKAATIWQWIGIAATGVGVADMITMFCIAAEMATTPTLTTRGIVGNSLNYYKDTDFVHLICNSNSGYNDSSIKEALVNSLDPDDSNFPGDYYNLVGSNVAGAYSMFWMAATVKDSLIDNTFPYNSKVGEADSYTEVVEEQMSTDATQKAKYLALNTLLENDTPLKNYAYDGICSTLTKETGTDVYQVYSNVKNYDDDKTLHSGNIENTKLSYVNAFDLYTGLTSEPTTDSWGSGFDIDEDGYFVPSVGLKSEVEPSNLETITEDGYAVYNITTPSQWEDIVYTINKRAADTSNEDSNFASYYLNAKININFVGGYKLLDVSDNTLNIFNGSITSKTSYYFTNLVLKNKGYDSLGLIKVTQGAKLTNIYVNGVVTIASINDVTNATSDVISAGILIGKVNEDAQEVVIEQSNIALSDFALDATSIYKLSNFGGIVGLVDVSSANVVKINNVILSVNFTGATSAMIAGDDATNKGLGTVAGKVEAGTLEIANVELKGSIELGSNFNNVGAFVGAIGADAVVDLGAEASGTNISNMTVKAASKANTSVGGVVGYNAGTVTISESLTLANTVSMFVSADVSSFEYFAVAGGVIGYNAGTVNAWSSIAMGKSEITSYDDVGYILAGYNQVELNGVTTAFPCKTGTSTGIFDGNNTLDTNFVIANNVITKFIASDISSNESLAQYFDSTYSATSTAGWNGLTDAIKSSDFTQTLDDGSKVDITSYDFKNEIKFSTSSGVLSSSYSYEVSELSKSGSYSLKYTFNQVNNVEFNTTDSNIKTYQWLLNVHYEAETKEQGVSTTIMKNADGTVKNASKITLDYKFIVRLISTNAKLDDNGVYTLQIIKINDYIKETQSQEVIYDTGVDVPVVDSEGNETGETQNGESTSYIDIISYKENSAFKPTVLYSKKIRMSEITSSDYTTVAEVENAIDVKAVSVYSLNENTSNGSTSMSYKSEYTSVTLTSKGFTFAVKVDGDNWNVAFNEQYDIAVDVTKTSSTTSQKDGVDYDNLTGEDAGNYEDYVNVTSSKTIIAGTGVYTRTLFSQTIKNGKVGTTVIDYTGTKPDYDYKAIIVNGSYSATTNPGVEMTFDSSSVDSNSNVTLKEPKTLVYNGNFSLLNGRINVSYKQPKYIFNDIEYDQINIYEMTIEGKEYIIASCVASGYSITDYVYLIAGTYLKSCGSISYTLSMENYSGLQSAYETAMTKRYNSFFPVIESSDLKISNIKDNIKEPESTAYEYIPFKYNYYSTTTYIQCEKFYASVKTAYVPKSCAVYLKYNGWEYTDQIKTVKEDSGSAQYLYFLEHNENFASMANIQTSDILNAIDYSSASHSAYESGIIKYTASDEAISGIEREEFERSWLKEGESLYCYYEYDGKIIGYVASYTVLDGSGQSVTSYMAYYNKQMHTDTTGSARFEQIDIYDQETETQTDPDTGVETEVVTDFNCKFYVFDSILGSPTIKVDASSAL